MRKVGHFGKEGMMISTMDLMQRIKNYVLENGVVDADDQVDLVYQLYLDDILGRVSPKTNPALEGAKIWDAIQRGVTRGEFGLVWSGNQNEAMLLYATPEYVEQIDQSVDRSDPRLYVHLRHNQYRDFVNVD